MVCNSTQSAFYKVIADYNNSLKFKENNCKNTREKSCEKLQKKSHKKYAENNKKLFEKNTQKKCAEKSHQNSCENCEKYSGGKSLQNLFSDSDFLFLCALIYILCKNGADQKIILALIFVLIG